MPRTSFFVALIFAVHGAAVHMLAFLYSYNSITIMLSTHSVERPFLHLAFSRAGEKFSRAICTVYKSFKVIKEAVTFAIWGFISFLLQGMAGSRSYFTKLFFCGARTSASPLHTDQHLPTTLKDGVRRV